MDWELLESWGIEKDSDPKKMCEVLEERQLEFLQMRRNENDSAKKSEIAEELKKLEAQLKQAKKDAKKRPDSPESNSVSTVSEPVASGDGQMAEMKKKLDAIKKQEEKRREEEKVICINGAESVNEVRFEIVSVYNGDKYNDTCVAEVQFLCR